jgi:hypothetical protein
MKINEFFLSMWGKLSELEPEPQFLTSWSWSWSRTKMDRLRNTDRTGKTCDAYVVRRVGRIFNSGEPDVPDDV